MYDLDHYGGADQSTIKCLFFEYLPSAIPTGLTLYISKGTLLKGPTKKPFCTSDSINFVVISICDRADNKFLHSNVCVGMGFIPV